MRGPEEIRSVTSTGLGTDRDVVGSYEGASSCKREKTATKAVDQAEEEEVISCRRL